MTRIRISIAHLALVVGLVGLIGMLIVIRNIGWGSIKQPLEFNHKIHAEKDLECIDCHQYYKEHPASGKPKLETCSTCHSGLLGKSSAEKTLLEYVKKDQEISWNRLYRVPQDVYFSHRRHVALGEIKCATCHGDIGTSAKPPSRIRKISMKTCLDCHAKSHVSNDCINCHR